MLNKIANLELLIEKAKTLKSKNFKPGYDGMTAAGALLWLRINGERTCRDILKGEYSPTPATAFQTAKKSGGYRKISKLAALDTIVQYAIIDVINSKCEAVFYPESFAYREGKGVGSAIELFRINAGSYRYAAKIDPIGCFDNIDYTVLRSAIIDILNDNKTVDLIMRFARAPYVEQGELMYPEKGIMQGAPLSPLLCNIYLHQLDGFLKGQSITFIRYADDVIIFADSLENIQSQTEAIRRFMETVLKLNVNEKKFQIDAPVNLKFLGYKFKSDKKGIIALESEYSPQASYHLWHESELRNSRATIEILSDGILRQKDYSAAFETNVSDRNIPVETTDSINIYSDVIFDSGFLKTALKNQIEINIFEKSGNMLGSFTPFAPLKSPRTTFEQLNAYYDEQRRMNLAKQFVLGSIHNLRLNIRYYNKQNPQKHFEDAINETYEIAKKIRGAMDYTHLLLSEARAREIYYSCFDLFITNHDFYFEKRTRKPPKNEVNSMISFGNTVLYNIIATEINKSALDVRIGFLHATGNRKQSLNLDIAELFKPLIVDRTIFMLVNKKMIKKCHFDYDNNDSVALNQSGKQVFLRAIYEKMDSVITEKSKKVDYRQIIKSEIYKLVRCFRENTGYSSFKQVR